ncbi:MAG TPA: xanthine dehydrogenase family protein molybdopterin-binding subunit [Armatimonadota bacterium]|nr:xanthine dehydrogenase family protein molybdopterin-binding subunit [Armatimonadota bacterium]
MRYTAVGKRTPRLDGPEKVTGKTQYGADITLPGMVWAGVLRSPHAHARIVRIRTGKAEKMPGVLALVIGKDFPRKDAEGVPILARDRVRYRGEGVAAVAAETQEEASAALSAIEVEYSPLPFVADVREAVAPGAPKIHEESEDPKLPNIAGVAKVKRGDVEAGFAEADRIFEDTFETPWVHQGFIEPHVSLADADPSTGKITIWTSTQAQFNQRADIAESLDLPLGKVRVIGLPVGGAFGGKIALCVEPIVGELARRSGRPVKLVVNRREDFVASRPCGAAVMELKTGVKNDGTLVALQARMLFDTGAHPGAQHGTAAALAQGPYRLPNVDIEASAVYTNKAPAGPRRSLTSPHVHFALESQLDIIASALRIDPLEIRLRNAARKGDSVAGGLTMPYEVAARVIRTAANRAGWSRRGGSSRRGGTARGGGAKARGMGIASGHWTVWAGASSAWVQVNEDGTISVVTGAINLTGTDTSFAQIAAESFGVPVSQVIAHQGDTETSPRNDGSWGSRILFAVGEVVRRASEDAKRQLAEALAEELGAPADDIEVSGGQVRAKGKRKSLTLAEAAERAAEYRGAIIGRGALSDLDYAVAVAAQVAEVEVDRETGEVVVKRLVCAQDVGFAINPMSVEGQIEGAVSQGIGYALSEEYVYDGEGQLLNDNFVDFRMPTSLDHPEFDVALIEEAKDSGPYGAKGVGEPPLVPTAAAIANAVYDAVGVRFRQLPMTPERVIEGMRRAP